MQTGTLKFPIKPSSEELMDLLSALQELTKNTHFRKI